MILNIIEEIKTKETNNIWIGSTFECIRNLQIDKRGSVGERFFQRVFTFSEFSRRIEYKDGDQGDWDLKVNNIRLEVKTSSIDVNKKFQNEGIRKTEKTYDGILFLGIAPENIFFKIIKYSEIPFDKLHCREKAKTGVGYKWDFKEHQMLKFSSFDFDENIQSVISEFKKVFSLK